MDKNTQPRSIQDMKKLCSGEEGVIAILIPLIFTLSIMWVGYQYLTQIDSRRSQSQYLALHETMVALDDLLKSSASISTFVNYSLDPSTGNALKTANWQAVESCRTGVSCAPFTFYLFTDPSANAKPMTGGLAANQNPVFYTPTGSQCPANANTSTILKDKRCVIQAVIYATPNCASGQCTLAISPYLTVTTIQDNSFRNVASIPNVPQTQVAANYAAHVAPLTTLFSTQLTYSSGVYAALVSSTGNTGGTGGTGGSGGTGGTGSTGGTGGTGGTTTAGGGTTTTGGSSGGTTTTSTGGSTGTTTTGTGGSSGGTTTTSTGGSTGTTTTGNTTTGNTTTTQTQSGGSSSPGSSYTGSCYSTPPSAWQYTGCTAARPVGLAAWCYQNPPQYWDETCSGSSTTTTTTTTASTGTTTSTGSTGTGTTTTTGSTGTGTTTTTGSTGTTTTTTTGSTGTTTTTGSTGTGTTTTTSTGSSSGGTTTTGSTGTTGSGSTTTASTGSTGTTTTTTGGSHSTHSAVDAD